MRRTLIFVFWFLAGTINASSVECTFVGLDESYEQKFLETVAYDLNDDIGSAGALGPYKIELLIYEGNFTIGVKVNESPLSGIQIPVETINKATIDDTVFGWINAYHQPKDGFMILRYECLRKL